MALIILLLCLGGRAKDPNSMIVTNFIALLGVLEFFYYIVQAFHAYRKDELPIMYLTGLALAGSVFLNLIFALFFC
jgi:hypothetical protein